MEKNINNIPKTKLNTNENKILKINPVYFSIELIPYNKILNNIMICLQKKLSPKTFNDIYKYFIKEIKKYINKSSHINLITNDINNINNNNKTYTEKNKPLIDFGLNKYADIQKNKVPKINKKINKKIKPLVGLSFSNKIDNARTKKNISISSFPNLNLNYLDLKKLYNNNYNYNNSFINNNSLNRTLNYTKKNNINNITNKNIDKNSKSEDKTFNSKKKKKIILNDNKYIINDRLPFNKINSNNNNQYNTINTSIHKNKMNNYLKINKDNNNQYLSNNIKKKISNNRTLTNIPYQAFIDIVNKNNNKKKFKTNIIRNITNAISINHIQNKDLSLYNVNKKKLKLINIKLQKQTNNGGKNLQKSLQTSEEMLKHIKNSLDDDNLKGMLNFSYENFLSKESERESKEYSIDD